MSANPLIAAIIMAGGRGTRMGIPDKHKCLFPVLGKPALFRLIDCLDDNKVKTKIIVIGALGEQLMAEINSVYNNIAYVYQPKQIGTGNAAKWGTRFLSSIPYEGWVIIIAGDSVLEPKVLDKLISSTIHKDLDLGLLVLSKELRPRFGHLIEDESGNIIASIEFWDLRKASFLKYLNEMKAKIMKSNNLSKEKNKNYKNIRNILTNIDQNEILNSVKEIAQEFYKIIPSKKKRTQIFPKLSSLLLKLDGLSDNNRNNDKNNNKNGNNDKDNKKESNGKNSLNNELDLPFNDMELFISIMEKYGYEILEDLFDKAVSYITINSKQYDPDKLLSNVKWVNTSIYMFKSKPLFSLIEKISSDNAQHEEYLTDIVELFSSNRYRIGCIPVDNPNDIMAFNTPEELNQINEYLSTKKN